MSGGQGDQGLFLPIPPLRPSFPDIADKKYEYTLKVILAFYDLGDADVCFFR